jgi:hypothetical protein
MSSGIGHPKSGELKLKSKYHIPRIQIKPYRRTVGFDAILVYARISRIDRRDPIGF